LPDPLGNPFGEHVPVRQGALQLGLHGLGLKLLIGIDRQVGERLNQQVVPDDHRRISIALGHHAPHLDPGLLSLGFGPDAHVGVAKAMDRRFVAARAGAEVDHDIYADLLSPLDKVIQILKRC
jgi:hypothetical protein